MLQRIIQLGPINQNHNMDKYTELENRIKVLEKWQKERMSQQIAFPLDSKSIEVLKKHFIYFLDSIEYTAGVGGNTFIHYLAMQDGNLFQLEPPSYIPYTVDVSTNYLTTHQISGNIKFFNDFPVSVVSDDTAPTPLDGVTGTTYYVINSDGYTFQLSATLGGAAINITDSGVGRQFILNS